MRDRFDPMDWFVSVAMTFLTGVIALAIAIHLLQLIWVWLVIVFATTVVTSVTVQLALWWYRRRAW